VHLPNLQFQHAIGRSPFKRLANESPKTWTSWLGKHRKYGRQLLEQTKGSAHSHAKTLSPVLGSRLINIAQIRLGMGPSLDISHHQSAARDLMGQLDLRV
jgi:hypothetical protein